MRILCALLASLAVVMALAANDAKQRAELAEGRLAEVQKTADQCNALAVTCLGWQARVSLDLESLANILREAL